MYENWAYDARKIHILKSQTETPLTATVCTRMFLLFQKRLTKCLFIVGSCHVHQEGTKVNEGAALSSDSFAILKSMGSEELVDQTVSSTHLIKIRSSFLECQYHFLDGLQFLMIKGGSKFDSVLDDEEARWEASATRLALGTDKLGSLTLEQAPPALKLKFKTEENRNTVRDFVLPEAHNHSFFR